MHAPLAPVFRVESRPLSELSAFFEEWRGLAARALQPNVFYEPEFALAAAPVFGQGVSVLLVWSAAGRLLGVFPSREQRRRYGAFGTRVGWTHPYGPLGLPLVDAEHARAAIAEWLRHLSSDPGQRGLLLLPLLPEGPLAAVLKSVLQETGRRSAEFDRHRRALLAPGNDRAGYLQGAVSSKRRKEMRRLWRRLDDLAAVSHVAARSAEEIAAATQEFLRLEAAGWKGAAGTAATLKPQIRAFLETAVADLAVRGKARADILKTGDRPIAATITLFSQDTAWTWKIAYDESFARYSPGVQLMLELSRDLLATPSLAQADSCAVPDHPMIDPIWRERLVLFDLLIAVKPPSRIRFGFACAAEAGRRRMLSAAKALLHKLRG